MLSREIKWINQTWRLVRQILVMKVMIMVGVHDLAQQYRLHAVIWAISAANIIKYFVIGFRNIRSASGLLHTSSRRKHSLAQMVS